MRYRIGLICELLGSLLILGALFLFLRNEHEAREAQVFAQTVVPEIYEQIALEQEPPADAVLSLPADHEDAEDNQEIDVLDAEVGIMAEKTIDGNTYIGFISIPELHLELPVMSSWDMKKLRISPCRYSGSLVSEDLVIMAHNYKSHFGQLSGLSGGAEVYFTDMTGQVWAYQVVAIDILSGNAVDEMISGEYDLTLFTCASNRSDRITVRCDRVQ